MRASPRRLQGVDDAMQLVAVNVLALLDFFTCSMLLHVIFRISYADQFYGLMMEIESS
jgi:hypothetical protein